MDTIDAISNVGFMLRTVRREDAVGVASAAFKKNTPAGTKVMSMTDPKMRMNLYALVREGATNETTRDLIARVQMSLRQEGE